MVTQRIVSECRGSWRWQDAYRIATYESRPAVDGRPRWYAVGHSSKMSWPQLRRGGYAGVIPQGSIHRKLVAEVAA